MSGIEQRITESLMVWEDCLECCKLTDIGMRRSNNQDSHAVVLAGDMDAWQRTGHLFIVADGMGAHAAGELASELSVAGISHNYHKQRGLSPPEALEKAFHETNAEIHRRGQANHDFHNMGTTTSVLLLLPQGALVAHVGDSRIYRLRGDQLVQLTFDHSLVWELRASGQLSEDSEVAHAVPKNVITRSIGPNASIQIDFEGPYPVEVGDTFLLCSDGLTGQVGDDEIGPILANMSPAEAGRVLIDLANLRGGPDNITVVVARVTQDAIATRRATSEPLTIGADRIAVRVHPAFWVVSAVCFLAAVGMFVARQAFPALVVAASGGVSLVTGVFFKILGQRRGFALGGGRQLGKGPYTVLTCPAEEQFVEKLAGVVDELREAAVENGWTVDWTNFDDYCIRAGRAAMASQNDEALRQYARAISFMMQELRQQRKRSQ